MRSSANQILNSVNVICADQASTMLNEIRDGGHIKCEKCNKTFANKKSLKSHLSEEHAY